MLALQTLEGPAALPPPDQSTALALADMGENRNQKPKTLPCKYCSKRFRSVQPTPHRFPHLVLVRLCFFFRAVLLTWVSFLQTTDALNMSKDMRGHILKRSLSPAAGIVVGRPLDDGKLPLTNSLSPMPS